MLDFKEKKLVAELRKQSSDNISNLAKTLKYPKSTVYDIVNKLENKGILSTVRKVAFEKIGYPIKIFIVVKTEPSFKIALKEYLLSKKNINSIYTINRGSNFHFEIIFRNQKEVEEFLEELEMKNTLTQISVYNVLESIMSEQFLTDEKHFE